MIVKEHILFEKFEEESDPIKDMGIGFFRVRDFPTQQDAIKFIAENIENIFMINKIPRAFMIFVPGGGASSIRTLNHDYLEAYTRKYITLRGKYHDYGIIKYFDLAEELFKLHKGAIKVTRKEWDNKPFLDPPIYEILPKFLEEKVNEKFSEESDPIEDLGIGLHEIFKRLKNGSLLKFKKTVKLTMGDIVVSTITKGSYMKITDIRNHTDNHISFYYSLYKDKFNLKNKIQIPSYTSWGMSYEYFKKYFEIVDKKDINEKFSEESDPVKDLGIGLEHIKKQYNWLVLPKFLNGLSDKDEEQLHKGFKMNLDDLFYLGEDNLNIVAKPVKHYLKKIIQILKNSKQIYEKTYIADNEDEILDNNTILKVFETPIGKIGSFSYDGRYSDTIQYFGDITSFLTLEPYQFIEP